MICAPDVKHRFQRAARVTHRPVLRFRGAPKRRSGAAAGLIEYHELSLPPGQASHRSCHNWQ